MQKTQTSDVRHRMRECVQRQSLQKVRSTAPPRRFFFLLSQMQEKNVFEDGIFKFPATKRSAAVGRDRGRPWPLRAEKKRAWLQRARICVERSTPKSFSNPPPRWASRSVSSIPHSPSCTSSFRNAALGASFVLRASRNPRLRAARPSERV